MFSILAKATKLLCILIHSVTTLPKSKQLFHFSNHESSWDVVVCRMDLSGPTTSVGTRTDYSVGPWDYQACAARRLMA
jgi:hypothetical protein